MIKADSKIVRVNEKFSENYKISFKEKDIILDCRAKVSNIFIKVISEKQIGIFGDYDIYIFYESNLNNEKDNYKMKKIQREFCKIINCSEPIKIDVNNTGNMVRSIKCELQCVAEKNTVEGNGLIYDLKITGLIYTTYMSKCESYDKHSDSGNSVVVVGEQGIKTEVWQYTLDKLHSAEELLGMDVELIKQISKNKK
ncbi:hypothetical protein JHL18_00410 [Clostridium sp. YIM B02505]|uniref:Uncharacterized protein n=1 Tax=Clostridium yunnanense TaxID=2800325 RepID=A0ABS1EIB8_9CLOT|nr:hypothetical protein [Clostridium yunnanense]MBK1809111.1 hypothetical protein [Clostridium yunnanense]